MKHSFLFICLCLFLSESAISQIISQPTTPAPSNATTQPATTPSHTSLLPPKSNKKKVGIAMAAAGVVCGVTGLVLYVGATVQVIDRNQQYNNAVIAAQNNGTPAPALPDNTDLIPRLIGGRLLMSAGAALTVIGVVFAVKGMQKEKQAKGVTLNFNPTGFRVAYNF